MTAYTTQKIADKYDGLSTPFHHLAKELKALGMKKPAETLSANKVKFINRILSDIRDFTKDEPEGRYLDLLDEDALPQYSDAILIISQYEGALGGFRDRYYGYLGGGAGSGWRVKG
jgi:hypothetical protein